MQMPEIPLTLPSSGAQGNGSGQGTGKLSLGLSKYRALVLDVSYRPILVVNWQRSLTLQIYGTLRSARFHFIFECQHNGVLCLKVS